MKSVKRYMTDGMELLIHDTISKLEVKETYKYLGILETDTVKQVEMKDKTLKKKSISGELENYSKQNSLAETLSNE